uniref:Uncharacterized protein n=1 Tax=Amphimedon queenslandica TaxID=400682 RepID=A0A1X7TS10_AMPQE
MALGPVYSFGIHHLLQIIMDVPAEPETDVGHGRPPPPPVAAGGGHGGPPPPPPPPRPPFIELKIF